MASTRAKALLSARDKASSSNGERSNLELPVLLWSDKTDVMFRFMQSDPWWSFAMAFNVFLVFFYNANPATFRKRIWIYCIICFGGPLVPAVVLVSIHDDAKGPVFGNAAVRRSDPTFGL